MLSRNQYFTQLKSARELGRVDYWIPGDQSHPRGIWFAFQLFWHGSGVIHCVPLKVNRRRPNRVANLRHGATHCCSLPPFDVLLWCRGCLYRESKATGRKKKEKNITFSPLCSNITLQCPTLIILYGANFLSLLLPCLWLCVRVRVCLCKMSVKYQLLKCQLTSNFQRQGCLVLFLIITQLSFVRELDLGAIMLCVTFSDCAHLQKLLTEITLCPQIKPNDSVCWNI